jgi:lysophospholipase L1-like esterase
MAIGSAGKGALTGSIILVGLIVLVSGVVWAGQRDRIALPPSEQGALDQSLKPPRHPTFAVLGDDNAAGYGPGWSSSWVRGLSDRMCWALMPVDEPRGAGIQGGTGFSTAGTDPGRERYLDRVPAVTAGKPQVVLVQGGLNDQGAPTSSEITDAATKTFTAVKEQIGTGTLIAIGPLMTPSPSTVPEELVRVSQAIRTAADSVGIPYIDPVAERWLADRQMFGEDGVHPNTDGYREYTLRLMDSLKFLGVESACKN